MRVRLVPLCLMLSGCFEQQISEAYDRDADGFPSDQLGGPDCDDENAAVYPGAVEICGNGLDDDCSGVVDDAGTGDVTFYVDKDGDGFPGTTPSSSCTAPEGSFSSLAGGADCDDTDPDRSPGVVEVWYDGVDQDCDGNDTDQDGDGFDAVSAGGDDCEDTVADVNPGMVEVCNNGVDDDCDGGAGRCALVGDVDAGELVHAVTGAVGGLDVGDFNGDGTPDLMIHDDGRSQWVTGPVEGILGTWTWDSSIFHFAGESDSVSSGDVDGDGVTDIVWASPLGLKLQPGPLQNPATVPDSLDWLAAPTNVSWFGQEVLVSDYGRGVLRRSAGPGPRDVSWIESGLTRDATVTATDEVLGASSDTLHETGLFSGFYSWNDSSAAWWSAPTLASELVVLPDSIQFPVHEVFTQEDGSGQLLVVHGPVGTTLTVVDASDDPTAWVDVVTVSLAANATVVSGRLCDVTADGVDDLIVGFYEGEYESRTRYGLTVFEGQAGGPEFLPLPSATLVSAGIDALVCADLTGDGVNDLVVSDSFNGFTEVLAGRGL